MQILNAFKNMLKKVKKALPRVPTQRIEKEVSVGAMGFHAYLQSRNIPFEGIYATGLTIKHLFTLTLEQMKLLKNWLLNEEKLLIYMVVVSVMLTLWLLLLMLVLVLYVVVLPFY